MAVYDKGESNGEGESKEESVTGGKALHQGKALNEYMARGGSSCFQITRPLPGPGTSPSRESARDSSFAGAPALAPEAGGAQAAVLEAAVDLHQEAADGLQLEAAGDLHHSKPARAPPAAPALGRHELLPHPASSRADLRSGIAAVLSEADGCEMQRLRAGAAGLAGSNDGDDANAVLRLLRPRHGRGQGGDGGEGRGGGPPSDGRLTVVIVTSEVAPFSKSGGLGDVAEKLGEALARLGHQVVCA